MNGEVATSFVPLDRTFHELAKYARESDDVDIRQAFFASSPLQWADLLKEWRIILLSEAGAG